MITQREFQKISLFYEKYKHEYNFNKQTKFLYLILIKFMVLDDGRRLT